MKLGCPPSPEAVQHRSKISNDEYPTTNADLKKTE
jgi:hypothetical protein